MSNMLKCPNPSCPYVFDPSQVPVGVVLSCPRCAMQFTLGAPAAAPQHQSTTAAVPPYQPQAPFPPTEADFGAVVKSPPSRSRQSAARAEPRGERSRDRQPARAPADEPPREGNLKVFLVAGLVAVLLAGAALAIIYALTRRDTNREPDMVTRWDDVNIGLEVLPSGWARDDTIKVRLGSPYVASYKRENPEGYVAFGANAFGSTDIKGRTPRPSRMKAEQTRAFNKVFIRARKDRGENDLLAFEQPLAPKWLGETLAQDTDFYPNGYKFRAQSPDGVKWAGEMYRVSHKGVAYYWMGWAQESDFEGLKSEMAAFRDKFRLLNVRKDWQETQTSVNDFKGDKVPYTISDADDAWQEKLVTDDEKKQDGKLGAEPDKLLRVRITPEGDRHGLADEAELRVYIIDPEGEPAETAKEFAQRAETNRIKNLNAEFKPPTFDVLTDSERGDPITGAAPRTAPVVRLRSKVAESADAGQLIVASAVRVGDKMVVVRCWCEYAKRDVLEARLVQIAASLR